MFWAFVLLYFESFQTWHCLESEMLFQNFFISWFFFLGSTFIMFIFILFLSWFKCFYFSLFLWLSHSKRCIHLDTDIATPREPNYIFIKGLLLINVHSFVETDLLELAPLDLSTKEKKTKTMILAINEKIVLRFWKHLGSV